MNLIIYFFEVSSPNRKNFNEDFEYKASPQSIQRINESTIH